MPRLGFAGLVGLGPIRLAFSCLGFTFPTLAFWGSRWVALSFRPFSFPTRPHQGGVNALVPHSPDLPEPEGAKG